MEAEETHGYLHVELCFFADDETVINGVPVDAPAAVILYEDDAGELHGGLILIFN